MADKPACPTCNDTGRVFNCPRWPGCACPPGTTQKDCPGKTAPCPDCGEGKD